MCDARESCAKTFLRFLFIILVQGSKKKDRVATTKKSYPKLYPHHFIWQLWMHFSHQRLFLFPRHKRAFNIDTHLLCLKRAANLYLLYPFSDSKLDHCLFDRENVCGYQSLVKSLVDHYNNGWVGSKSCFSRRLMHFFASVPFVQDINLI